MFTRMWRGPSSRLSVRAADCSAAFDIVYPPISAGLVRTIIEPTITTAPPAAGIAVTAARVSCRLPNALTSIARRHTSRSACSNGWKWSGS